MKIGLGLALTALAAGLGGGAGGGGAPTVTYVSTTNYEGPNSNLSSWTPFTGLDCSDCTIAIFVMSSDGGPTITTTSTGWVKLGQATASGTGIYVFYKLNPTASETLAFTSTGSERYVGQLIRLSGGSAVTGTFGTTDPPSHDAGATAGFWIAASSNDRSDDAGITAAPTNYINFFVEAHVNTAGSRIASGTRVLAAQVEDPGAFTVSGGNINNSVTIAIT